MNYKFECGQMLKDKITGYSGIVMARTDYYTGCRHYGLLSRELTKEGKEKDWQYFDENRLVIAGKSININKKDDYQSGVFPTPPQA